jgi:hypothetical protein
MPPLLPCRFGDHDGFYHDPAEVRHESEGVGYYAYVRDGGRVVWPHDYNPCCAAIEAQYFAEMVVMPSRYAVVSDETVLSGSVSRRIIVETQVILW